jgi:hypothetical protein
MSNYWETLHQENCEGFDIVASISPEDIHPSECFDTSIDTDTGKPYYDIDEMCQDIDNGRLQWFVLRVQAFKNGVLLGSSYLGGNLYINPQDIISDGSYQDFRTEAIDEANETLLKLMEA